MSSTVLESGAIVLARMDSNRHPSKVLRPVGGIPLVELIVRRLLEGGFAKAEIALATTDRSVDEPLVAWAIAFGVGCFRGATQDVASRFLDCAAYFGFRYASRINADSPFVEGALLRDGLRTLERGDAVFVSNIIERTYPYGVSLEAVEIDHFRQSLSKATPAQREHVTAHLYASLPPQTMSVTRSGPNLSSVRLCIDTMADEERIAGYLRRYGCDPITVNAIELAKAIFEHERTS